VFDVFMLKVSPLKKNYDLYPIFISFIAVVNVFN
jgi:hypothetical protein